MSGYVSIKNGQKGGRPRYGTNFRFDMPEANLVILTPPQYCTLVERYGCELFYCALGILQNWFASGSPSAEKYIGKNNYAHFRSDGWVINSARSALQ